MQKNRSYHAVFVHGLKVWAFMVVTTVPLWFAGQYLPHWLFIFLDFCYGIFVLMPIAFGIGPLGRRFGRQLNEAAVAHAKAEREALGPVRAASSSEAPSGPGGEQAR